MAEIKNTSLVMLIQILDDRIRVLKDQVEKLDENDSDLSGIEEELMICSQVEIELRDVYKKATKHSGDLLSYDELVKE